VPAPSTGAGIAIRPEIQFNRLNLVPTSEASVATAAATLWRRAGTAIGWKKRRG
jgi:hypothetical protein